MSSFKRGMLVAGLFLFNLACVSAQTSFEYAYDAAGNRIRRRLLPFTVDDDLGGLQGKSLATDTTVIWDGHNLRLYPNPTKGTVVFETAGETPIGMYRLSDVDGKPLESNRCGNTSLRLDLSPYPAGVLLLEVVIGEERHYFKIIKQ